MEVPAAEPQREALRARPLWRWLAIAVFAILIAITTSRHEIWHDEAQAWLISAHSDSIPSLLAKLRYEGHPAAWYLLLYGLSRMTLNPLAMQALHVVIATASAWVL